MHDEPSYSLASRLITQRDRWLALACRTAHRVARGESMSKCDIMHAQRRARERASRSISDENPVEWSVQQLAQLSAFQLTSCIFTLHTRRRNTCSFVNANYQHVGRRAMREASVCTMRCFFGYTNAFTNRQREFRACKTREASSSCLP